MTKWLKNTQIRLFLISTLATLSLLCVLPRIPITIKNKLLNIDSYIGGYYINLFNDRFVLDLRNLKKGLDLEGGVKITLKADTSKIPASEQQKAIDSAIEVISKRVNLLGVAEPYIAPIKSGDEYRIVVEIPGVEDVASAVELIGQTAQLQFKQLGPDVEWDESKFQEYFFDKDVWQDSNVSGADLKGVDLVFDSGTGTDLTNAGSPKVKLLFSNEGRQKFSELAKANVNKPIAIFLDKDQFPLSMPVVNANLAEGLTEDPVIEGRFDMKTAKALSVQIRAGALPVPVEVMEQKTIEATLGSKSVEKSFFAGLVGLLLVFIFMIVMYGRLGVLADVALVIYALVVLSLFKIIPVVLTLPGIAGFVLSIGMATDASILVFERIKEELVWGKPRNLAIRYGFERAWNSIRDSNVSSLLTCAVLFYFGTGPVRGFAVTLALGIVVSLFTSIFVVKTFIEAFNIAKLKERSEGHS